MSGNDNQVIIDSISHLSRLYKLNRENYLQGYLKRKNCTRV